MRYDIEMVITAIVKTLEDSPKTVKDVTYALREFEGYATITRQTVRNHLEKLEVEGKVRKINKYNGTVYPYVLWEKVA